MKKIYFLFLLILTVIMVSCSKSDDDSIDPFFRRNGIDPKEYPFWTGWSNYKSPGVYGIYTGFKINTDNYYIWFCDEEYNIIGSTFLSLPKQIIEDQGYGNYITCELDGYSEGAQFVNAVDNVELYIYEPIYNNLKNKFCYLLFYDGKNIVSHKIDKSIEVNSNVLKWYNNSLLLGSPRKPYSICLSMNGDIISINDFKNTIWEIVFDSSYIAIPLDYTKAIALSKTGDKDIYIYTIENDTDISYSVLSPFYPKEDYLINSASLIESKEAYYIIECQLTAYSGEKRTIRIKISPKEKTAEIVS